MVSFQAPLSPNQRKPIPESDNLSKKRKWEEPFVDQLFEKRSKAEETTNPIFDIDQHDDHFETPLPLEWQRCLDIQSGQIHFYNTKTHRRTCKDPRRSPDPDADVAISPVHASLDLELNLTCDQSLGKNNMDDHDDDHHHHLSNLNSGGLGKQKWNSSGGIRRCPSWLEFEMDHKQEMVATVCMRCHMLVMLCRSSPACPNCKFMHPPDQNPPTLFKSRCSFFCL